MRKHRKTKAFRRSIKDSISKPLSEGGNALGNAVGNAMEKRVLPEPTYRRGSIEATRMFALAQSRAWPAISLGEWEIEGKAMKVAVPATRLGWEQAVEEFPVELAAAAAQLLEAMSE